MIRELTKATRIANPIFFVAALLLFSMPFVQFSCNNEELATLSGKDFITGTEINAGLSSQKVSPRIDAIVAFLGCFIGIFLGLRKELSAYIAISLFSLLSAMCLMSLYGSVTSAVKGEGNGMVEAVFLNPFWFLVALFLLIFGANLLFFILQKALPSIPNAEEISEAQETPG